MRHSVPESRDSEMKCLIFVATIETVMATPVDRGLLISTPANVDNLLERLGKLGFCLIEVSVELVNQS